MFKEQLEACDQKADQQYKLLQKEKNEEKNTADKAISMMNAQQRNLEKQLYEKQGEIEKSRAESTHLKQKISGSEKQIASLLEKSQQLSTELHEKDQQLNIRQGENHLLQQQLLKCEKNIAVLQEEKHLLLQQKNPLSNAPNKKSKRIKE